MLSTYGNRSCLLPCITSFLLSNPNHEQGVMVMTCQEESRPDMLETGVSSWSYSPEEPEGEMNIDFYHNWSAHW